MPVAARKPLEATGLLVINEIGSPRYWLLKPLHVEIDHDGTYYILSEPKTGIFSYDREVGPAVQKFLQLFVENFELLEEHQDNLSESLREELTSFRAALRPIRQNADPGV